MELNGVVNLSDSFTEESWFEGFLLSSTEICRTGVMSYCRHMKKIGLSDDYLETFQHKQQMFYDEIVSDMEVLEQKYYDKIEILLNNLQHLCKDLHMAIPHVEHENVPLTKIYKTLKEHIEMYTALLQERRAQLDGLLKKQEELSKTFGRTLKQLQLSPLPDDEQVNEFRVYLEALEAEKMDREEKFFQIKQEIVDMTQELGTEPQLDYEKKILSLSDDMVLITDSDMSRLVGYHNRLRNQSARIKEEVHEIRFKLDDLWNKLEISIVQRDAFILEYTGSSIRTLEALKSELAKCEELKRANMKKFIEKQRKEIVNVWNLCRLAENERNFSFLTSECYNDDLFDLHDLEIQKWQQYHEQNKTLFTDLIEYEKLWEDKVSLDSSNGANRYKNRGGQLLIEEKRRNKINRQLPKLKEKIVHMAESYRMETGRDFSVSGLRILDYIEKLAIDHETSAKVKLSAKKQQRDITLATTGTSRCNLFPSTSRTPRLTPASSQKRKFATPSSVQPKRLKLLQEKKAATVQLPKIKVSRRLSAQRRSMRRKQRISSSSANLNETNMTNYDTFMHGMSTKNDCRSTNANFELAGSTPQRVLRQRNA